MHCAQVQRRVTNSDHSSLTVKPEPPRRALPPSRKVSAKDLPLRHFFACLLIRLHCGHPHFGHITSFAQPVVHRILAVGGQVFGPNATSCSLEEPALLPVRSHAAASSTPALPCTVATAFAATFAFFQSFDVGSSQHSTKLS